MFTVSIIGVGRVGGALALALPREQFSIEHLVRRSDSAASDAVATRSIPLATTLDQLSEINSEIIFITTQDAEIADVAQQLKSKLSVRPFVFHTSGALSSSVLNELAAIGCKTGSIHPLVSISNANDGQERFKNSFFCIEGQREALEMSRTIVASLGGLSFSIDTQFKTLYHAAAVTACGHLVALFDAAVEMMTKCGLSEDEGKRILLPLVQSTVQNIGEQNTAAALTGTFARADVETFVEHLKVLNTTVSDEILEIYLLLGERSLELAAKSGVSRERVDALRTKVSIAKSKVKW